MLGQHFTNSRFSFNIARYAHEPETPLAGCSVPVDPPGLRHGPAGAARSSEAVRTDHGVEAGPTSRKPAPAAAPGAKTAAQAPARQQPASAASTTKAATRSTAGTQAKPRVASKPTSSARRATASKRTTTRITGTPRPAGRAVAKAPAPRPAPAAEEDAEQSGFDDGRLRVQSKAVLVVDPSGQELYSKNDNLVLPIASITKLMTAVVVLDAGLSLDETITVALDDKDFLRNSHSRLDVGSSLSRVDMLRLALMSSENRAAAALARTYPGSTPAFVRAMNAKARQLGMMNTRFYDSTGLNGNNVSTARDLVKLVQAACEYPLIRDATTTSESEIQPVNRDNLMTYRNSNRLVRGGHWDIGLSKTGYLNEAGRCLVMEARVAGRPLIFVLLNGQGRLTPMGDAARIRAWLEASSKTS